MPVSNSLPDARKTRISPAVAGSVVEQRRLPDSSLPADDQHPALPHPRACDQRRDAPLLGFAADQHRSIVGEKDQGGLRIRSRSTRGDRSGTETHEERETHEHHHDDHDPANRPGEVDGIRIQGGRRGRCRTQRRPGRDGRPPGLLPQPGGFRAKHRGRTGRTHQHRSALRPRMAQCASGGILRRLRPVDGPL